MTEQKYKLGEKFWEVNFQIPMKDWGRRFSGNEVQEIVDKIFEQFEDAVNVKALHCSIEADPARLSVSAQSSGYTVHNTKAESQIMEDGLKPCKKSIPYIFCKTNRETCEHCGLRDSDE